MHGKFHACLLWSYFLGILPNEQYDSYFHGHYRCSTFPDTHSFLTVKWNLLHSQQILHRQELSIGSLFFFFFFFFQSVLGTLETITLGLKLFLYYSYYFKCSMRWERQNPLQSLCCLLSFVLALLYFHSDEARVVWNSQISGKFPAKIQLLDIKRGPLVKFIHCHHLLGSCGGNCAAMQYNKKWVRLHYMVKTLEKVPWAISMKFASASNKCHIRKAAAHILLCFSEERIHLFWESSLKQDSLSLVLPPAPAATNTCWHQQQTSLLSAALAPLTGDFSEVNFSITYLLHLEVGAGKNR